MKWAKVCFLMLLVGTAGAQMLGTRPPRDVSARWAEHYAAVYRVPVELVAAIIDEESGWNPYAVSKKGAAGIMQLMPATAVRFGVRNRFVVEENIRGGVAYLAWLKQRFNGDLRLITAAYYVGENTISSRGLEYSSPDVQGYVKRVAQRYRMRRALRAWNEFSPAEANDEVTDEKHSGSWLVVARGIVRYSRSTASKDHSAGTQQSHGRQQDHRNYT